MPGVMAGCDLECCKAEEVRQVVPHSRVGGRGCRGAKQLADEAGDQQASADLICRAMMTVLSGGENATADESRIAKSISGALEHRLVPENVIHYPAATSRGLISQVIVRGRSDGLPIELDRGRHGTRTSRAEAKLLLILARRELSRAVSHFNEAQDVCPGIVGGWRREPGGCLGTFEGIATVAAQFGAHEAIEIV